MVDCGSPRCAQSRRSFRRDLQHWGKKLPVLLGLERIAADYVDKETSELLLHPYPEWEKCMTCDFESTKKCFHCDKKLPNIYRRIHRIIDESKRGKVSNGKICFRSLQDLMPFCLDFYKNGFGHELFSEGVRDYFINASPISAEPLPSHVTEVPTVLSSYLETNSNPEHLPGRGTERAVCRQASTTTDSAPSVLAPGDNSLNRLRVPIVSSCRAQRINEREQKDVIGQETLSVLGEDISNLKHPRQSDFSNRKKTDCVSNRNHWKSLDSHSYHYKNSIKSHFPGRQEECPSYQKRLRSHLQYNAGEVVISDTDEEESVRSYQRSLNRLSDCQVKGHQQLLQGEQQQHRKREDTMSALELFESAHRRLRLDQLEQLGHLGQLGHDYHQQHLESVRSAASASLFRLANQHLLPPGVDHSAFSAAAAAASVSHATAALPFLLPILPCSLKLKLETEEEEMISRRVMSDRDTYIRNDNLCESRYLDCREDPIFKQNYQNKNQGISSMELRANNPESIETLQQRCRLDNIRRMHNLNGTVRQEQRQDSIIEGNYKALTSRCVATRHADNEQHDFYQKELKLPLLTNLVRKLVHQKFEEITQGSRQGSRCESTVADNLENLQTHPQQKEDTFAPYNPYLTPIPAHFLTAALASKDENIATPMYNYIMESIYTNMMKEDSSLATKPLASIEDAGDTLKGVIKGTPQKTQRVDTHLHKEIVSCPKTSETLQSGSAKSGIWSPAFSAVSSEVKTKEKNCNNQESLAHDKDIVSPPAKRLKKENLCKNKSDGERRSTIASSSSVVTSSDGFSSGKKTRPKRGQYRKYNSQLLMDAVKAVQRGEMSVHRAGSFYGVPHSTLEYKVKERHLLRQKKPREAGESSDSKTASEASSPPPPSSSTSPKVSLKAPTKSRRTLRTQSQDSCSSIDGEGPAADNVIALPNSSRRKYRKAITTADSSSPRSSISSSTPPSPGLPPMSPPIAPAPVLNPPVSSLTSTSPPSSPPLLSSPQPAPASPNTASTRQDKPSTSTSLGSSVAWFQPYLDVPPSMQQMITKTSPSTLESLGHTNSASELLRKLQHKVQAKESGRDNSLSAFSLAADESGGSMEISSCGQDRRAYDLFCQPHRQGSPGSGGPLQDRLMLYKQSA